MVPNRATHHIFHATSKIENFKIVIFITKVLPWNCLKWRGKSEPKESCGYFSYFLDAMKQVLGEVFGLVDTVVETRAKNCSEPFCNN